MANQQVTRSLGAIVAIDAVGYSRQMGRDEEATRRTLQTYREVIAERVARGGGWVFGVAGDSAMAVLPDTLTALTCALDIERAVEALGATLPEARRMPLRIGIHFGRVLVEGEDVYGDDVNIAARIEALAGAGGICLSGTAFERVEGVLPLGYEAYGPQRLKNITRPVAVYRVRREAEMVGRVVPGKAPRPRSRWRLVAAVAALVAAGVGVWSLYLQDQAAERAAGLRAALHDVESRVASRTAELQSALQAAAAREAARQSAEAALTETLLAGLREAEARAATERQRAEGLHAELQSAKAVAGTADARRAERQRAEALIASRQIAERRAGVERVRLEGLLADLDAAASRAADRADAAGARVSDRNRIADLRTALAMTEREAAQEIESAEALLAAQGEGDDSAERARDETLLATLREAGQSAAIELKRAELVLNSWEAPKDVAADAVVHAKARDRAEALHARWREAEDTTVTERLRAEALLAKLDLAEAPPPPRRRPAELERVKEQLAIIKGGAEPEQRAEDEVPAVPAREAVTPTSSQPENGAAAPQATAQLAALPSQPEATDAAADKSGEEASDAASLEAVERLLQERQPELLDALNAYFPNTLTEFAGGLKRVKTIWGIKVLGRKGDSYRVRMDFEPTFLTFDSNQIMVMDDQPYHYSRETRVLVKTTGAKLEIAGHEYVSD